MISFTKNFKVLLVVSLVSMGFFAEVGAATSATITNNSIYKQYYWIEGYYSYIDRDSNLIKGEINPKQIVNISFDVYKYAGSYSCSRLEFYCSTNKSEYYPDEKQALNLGLPNSTIQITIDSNGEPSKK